MSICKSIAFILITVGLRLLPHAANATPMLACLLLLRSQKTFYFLFTLPLLLICSDLAISYFFHYPAFGSWTLFTYSAWIAIACAARWKTNTVIYDGLFIFFASLGFWLWTNFGVWLFSSLYLKNIFGLFECYIAALPFLKNQILGDFFWCGLFFLFKLIQIFYNKNKEHLFSCAVLKVGFSRLNNLE